MTNREAIAQAIEFRVGDFAYSEDPGVDFGLKMAAEIARDVPLPTVGGWISLEERKPAPSTWVVAMYVETHENPTATILKTDNRGDIGWYDKWGFPIGATHWAPCEPPPENKL